MAQDRSGHGRPGESRSGEEEVQDTEQEDQDTEQAEELVPIQRLRIHSHSRILVAFADLLYTDVVTPFGMFAECFHLQVYPFHVQMWSHPSVDCVSTAKSSPKQFIF